MTRPASWKSENGRMYLTLMAYGRTENDLTRLSDVAISSDKARPRKSISLSEPTFWNGNTAIAVCAAGEPGAEEGCWNIQSRKTARRTAKIAALARINVFFD